MHKPLALLLAALAGACASASSSTPAWEQYTALKTPDKLGGCAIGDIDARYKGEEIAAVSSTGHVYAVRYDEGIFRSELVAQLPGEMIQCAIGDLDPAHPGEELVAVGMAEGGEDDPGTGVVWMFSRTEQGWERRQVFEDSALLHAVAIGNADPDRPGRELVVAGFSRQVHLIVLEDGSFSSTSIADLSGNAKGVAIGPDGIVVACDDGSLIRIFKGPAGWTSIQLAQFSTPLARVDVRPEDGAILVCANDGRLRLIQGRDTYVLAGWEKRLRGAVFTDVDPRHDGDEMATVGYDGLIYVVTRDRDAESQEYVVTSTPVGRDSDRFHHLAAGAIRGLGHVLVACGYSGRVIVVDAVDR